MNCKNCSTIGDCPFSFTEESETVQNYGCLPTPMEIVSMRIHFGKTWACHSNPNKPCLGSLNYLKGHGYEYKVIDKDLLSEDSDWHLFTKKLLPEERKFNILFDLNLCQDLK